MYEYNAKVTHVVDGDTIDLSIDLGFDIWYNSRVRFLGIDTPESRTRDLEEKKRGAEHEADLIIQEARMKANSEMSDYTAKVKDLKSEIHSLEKQKLNYFF